MISRSLSRRYIEDLLVSGREDARRIADDLDDQVQAEDLQVLERRREQIYRSFEGILKRQVYESIVVTDREGRVAVAVEQPVVAALDRGLSEWQQRADADRAGEPLAQEARRQRRVDAEAVDRQVLREAAADGDAIEAKPLPDSIDRAALAELISECVRHLEWVEAQLGSIPRMSEIPPRLP